MHYDCPLKAAYMTKEFRVKIKRVGASESTIKKFGKFYTAKALGGHLSNKAGRRERYHVDPSNYDMFEPMEGEDACIFRLNFGKSMIGEDIISDVIGFYYSEDALSEIIHEHEAVSGHIKKIIQRNNKPFITPEEK